MPDDKPPLPARDLHTPYELPDPKGTNPLYISKSTVDAMSKLIAKLADEKHWDEFESYIHQPIDLPGPKKKDD